MSNRVHGPMLAVALLVAVMAGPVPAGAQAGGRLDFVAQTLFVHDDPAEFVLRISGAPPGALIEFRIERSPITDRDDLRASFHETEAGSLLSFFSCPLDGSCDTAQVDFGTGGLVTVVLDDTEIGEALRSNPGALPVRIRLLDPDGAELDLLHTALVIPAANPSVRAEIAFLARLGAPPAIQPDQSIRLDVEQLLEDAETIASRPELPAAVEVVPETVDGLRRSNPDTLDVILEAIGDRALLHSPWVTLDEEAWRLEEEHEEVERQYERGADALQSAFGRSPSGLVRLDASAGPDTIALLRGVGADSVIVDDTRLSTPDGERPPSGVFDLLDSTGETTPVLHIDTDLHETLDHDDAELGGYQALAEIVVATMSAPEDLGILLDINRIDPVALDVLLDGIDDHGGLAVTTPNDLLGLGPARPETADPPIELVSATASEVGIRAREQATARSEIGTLEAMLAPEREPLRLLYDQVLAAASSDLEPDEALAYTTAVRDRVAAATTGIEIVPGDRITLTDRRTDLPLSVDNGQALPVNVELRLSAEKLRFPDGASISLTLRPGTNQIVIPVETLASGDARVTAVLTTPDGRMELGTGTVDIRSTAISGLGLVISIIALLTLGAWWIRTILRIRRNRAAATVADTPDHAAPTGASTTTEGEP